MGQLVPATGLARFVQDPSVFSRSASVISKAAKAMVSAGVPLPVTSRSARPPLIPRILINPPTLSGYPCRLGAVVISKRRCTADWEIQEVVHIKRYGLIKQHLSAIHPSGGFIRTEFQGVGIRHLGGNGAGMVSGPLAPTVYSVKRRLKVDSGCVLPSGMILDAVVPGGINNAGCRLPS